MTAIVILALVALFIGLRLYSVLGERTGHEQPILKPADPEADARLEPRVATRAAAPVMPSEPDDFKVSSPLEVIRAVEKTSRILSALLASIAAPKRKRSFGSTSIVA